MHVWRVEGYSRESIHSYHAGPMDKYPYLLSHLVGSVMVSFVYVCVCVLLWLYMYMHVFVET